MLKNLHPLNTDPARRKFIFNLVRAVGVAPLFLSGYATHAISVFNADGELTVGQVMDKFISQIPGAPFSDTVDTLKAGDRSIKVTGIVTTMFATIEVIRKAIADDLPPARRRSQRCERECHGAVTRRPASPVRPPA